jgi:hypothetical protein
MAVENYLIVKPAEMRDYVMADGREPSDSGARRVVGEFAVPGGRVPDGICRHINGVCLGEVRGCRARHSR